MQYPSNPRPTLADLIRAWICGWPIIEPDKLYSKPAHPDNHSTVELIYEELRLALEVQRANRGSLETKSGILIGFTGTILALLIAAQDQLVRMPYTGRWLVIAGGILFVLSLFPLGLVSWVRPIRVDPNPLGLAEMKNLPVEELRLRVIANRKDAWQENATLIKRNARYLKIAILIQGIAAILLATALLITISTV